MPLCLCGEMATVVLVLSCIVASGSKTVSNVFICEPNRFAAHTK